ncbi:MAG: hypothetical protein V4580_19160 [Bacteroidota bacterium]
MKRPVLTLLATLLCIVSVIGQIQVEVNKILKTKNFTAFKKYADNLPSRSKQISAHWVVLRDLTPDYKEGVFYFEKSIPDKENTDVSSVYTFRLRLITSEKKILYYELSEKKNKKIAGHWEPYYETIDKFRNDSIYTIFQRSFQEIFRAEVNDRELFVDDFVYGLNCGNTGENPTGRKLINELVKYKDKKELLKWLQSTNTEKQVYAVDGLYQLKQTGLKLTVQELNMIKFVMGKKGTLYTCSGCIHMRQEINSVTKHFIF